MSADSITARMCAAYLIGLERGFLTASEMHLLADKNTALAYQAGLHERKTGKPLAEGE